MIDAGLVDTRNLAFNKPIVASSERGYGTRAISAVDGAQFTFWPARKSIQVQEPLGNRGELGHRLASSRAVFSPMRRLREGMGENHRLLERAGASSNNASEFKILGSWR